MNSTDLDAGSLRARDGSKRVDKLEQVYCICRVGAKSCEVYIILQSSCRLTGQFLTYIKIIGYTNNQRWAILGKKRHRAENIFIKDRMMKNMKQNIFLRDDCEG
jgi:hypothetical protein